MDPITTLAADPGDAALLERMARHLECGGLLGYPTETVYGLGAAATVAGVEGVSALKERESDKPFLVLVPEDAPWEPGGLEWPAEARALAAAFWPGPLTLVVPDPRHRYPEGVRSRAGGVAVRVSPHPFVGALLRVWRRPLLSTSANRPGGRPARTVLELRQAVEGRPGVGRLWIADGGDLPPAEPSTVVDCTVSGGRVIRRGGIPTADLRKVISGLDDGN